MEGNGKKIFKSILNDLIVMSSSLLRVLREKVCDLIVSFVKKFVIKVEENIEDFKFEY